MIATQIISTFPIATIDGLLLTLPPFTEGLEYTEPVNRLHYAEADNLLNFSEQVNRLHYEEEN